MIFASVEGHLHRRLARSAVQPDVRCQPDGYRETERWGEIKREKPMVTGLWRLLVIGHLASGSDWLGLNWSAILLEIAIITLLTMSTMMANVMESLGLVNATPATATNELKWFCQWQASLASENSSPLSWIGSTCIIVVLRHKSRQFCMIAFEIDNNNNNNNTTFNLSLLGPLLAHCLWLV